MSKTLLLADDSVTIQKVVGITFASEDVDLVTVDNGDDALARAREIRPDLVLADVSMPGLDGYELCHAIKTDAMISGTPVVLLTGTFEVQDESRAAQAGADAQIAKPFEAQALVDLVRGLIDSGAPTAMPAAAPAAAAPEPLFDETPAPMAAPLPEPRPEPPVAVVPEAPPVQAANPVPAPTPLPAVEPEPFLAAEPEPVLAAEPEIEAEPILDAVPLAEPEPMPLPEPPAPRVDAPVAEPPLQADAPAEDTDFSFSDLEFARSATTGSPPDATQVLASMPVTPDEPALMPAAPADALDDEPLGLDPLEPEAPQAPTIPQGLSLQPSAQSNSMTEPRLPSSPDDSMRADADAVPHIDLVEPAQTEALAFDKTRLMDPSAASEMLESADLEAIPEEPIGEPADSGWQPAPPALEADPSAVDAPTVGDSQGDSQPILATEISSETIDAPAEVQLLGEQTMGGSEIFGDPLGTTAQSMGTTVDQRTEPDVPVALDAQALRDSIEKLAWDAFGPMSEQLVHEVVKKIEQIAWDVVPQLAEKIVQQEIRRLTHPDDD
jgi:CheY-like chemotaxis protein